MSEERLDELREILYNPNLKGYLPNVCNELLQELEQQVKKQKEVISKVIECIEKDYYSKNTVDIESIGITTNKLLQVRKILKEVSE